MTSCDVDLDKCFELAKSLAIDAGNAIKDAYSKRKAITIKSSQTDLVTETDVRVEKMVFSSIKERFPDHCFIGEESTSAGDKWVLTDQPTWIIDPIDGTTNFVHTFPYTCISIGFVVNKRPQIGIIYNPIQDEMYTARLGQGAYCNNNRIHVNDCKDYSQSLLIVDTGACSKPEDIDAHYENVGRHKKHTRGIRTVGSAALSMCMVAAGSADGYYEFGVHCWDVAAGWLIVEEAGGVLLGPDGSKFDMMNRCAVTACSMEVAVDIVKDIQRLIQYPRD